MSSTQRARRSSRSEIGTAPGTATTLRTIEARDRGSEAANRSPAATRLAALRAQPPHRDLRHRRSHVPLPRGAHVAALHELRLRGRLRPDRAPHVRDGRGGGRDPGRRQLRLHPLLLPGQGIRVPAPPDPHGLLGADGVFDARAGPLRHLRLGDRARAERELAPRRGSPGQRREPRRRNRRPALGERQLRPDDESVPRRAAVGRLLHRDAPEHRHHRPAHGDPRRRLQGGPPRDHRRQPQRHPGRVPRAARLPPRAARPPVRPEPSAHDEPLRDPAHGGRTGDVGDELRRPPHAGEAPARHVRAAPARAVLARHQDQLGDGAPLHRLPGRLAGVRVFDRGRGRGEARLFLRPHLPDVHRRLGGGRPEPVRAVDRPPARAPSRATGRPRKPSRHSRSRASSSPASSS